MDLNEEHREQVKKSIIESVIHALENSNLREEDLPGIGQFVLDRVNSIQTHEELVLFVGELATKWPIFKHIESEEKNEAARHEETKVADRVTELTQSGKIEEALGLAKSVTDI